MEYNVLDFGAAGDGVTSDTRAIQAAVDACRASGGGRVVLPGGRIYRSGMLTLCSNLEFHLEMGAVLKGSDNLADYLPEGGSSGSGELRGVPSYINCSYTGAPNHFFLYAKDCCHLAVTGLGTIDGNQEAFYGTVTKWHIEGAFYPRAPMMFFENCEHLTIRDVTLTRSAFWTVHPVGCRDVLIEGLRILNDLRMANCDGIDPDHCQNVRIANCHIECADDCIVFKNTRAAMGYGPCENITVTNCTLTSTSAAVKFGTESEDLFRNILVENCVISRSNRGISLQLRDGGSIENVSFRNIAIDTRLFHPEMYWGAAEPIAVTVLRRREDAPVGTIRNVLFSGVLCTGENGILLWSEAPGGISGLTFENVSLRLRETTGYQKGLHDLRPNFSGAVTAAGLAYVFAHQISESSFHHCRFTADETVRKLIETPFRVTGCDGLDL